jgi:hypothetical protein
MLSCAPPAQGNPGADAVPAHLGDVADEVTVEVAGDVHHEAVEAGVAARPHVDDLGVAGAGRAVLGQGAPAHLAPVGGGGSCRQQRRGGGEREGEQGGDER